MSAKSESDQPVTSRAYNAGGLFAFPRPDEIVVPLRREEFDILCEGGVGEEKSSRDVYIGGLFGVGAGLVAFLAGTDWVSTWQPERRWWFLIPFLLLCVMITATLVGACIHQKHLTKVINNSPFSRLRARLLGLFNEARTPDIPIEKLPGSVVQQIDASVGPRWENVANMFWLGSDLHFTLERVWGTAPKEKIARGLTQSYHHLSQLQMTDSDPGKILYTLKAQVASMPEAALNQQWRNDFAVRLTQVIKGVSDLAISEQPGFMPNP